jgi:hypothetical protein
MDTAKKEWLWLRRAAKKVTGKKPGYEKSGYDKKNGQEQVRWQCHKKKPEP